MNDTGGMSFKNRRGILTREQMSEVTSLNAITGSMTASFDEKAPAFRRLAAIWRCVDGQDLLADECDKIASEIEGS